MAIRIGDGDVPNLNRSFRGHWHTVQAPHPVSGTLIFSSEEGLELQLNGTLLGTRTPRHETILGRAIDGTELSVQRGHYRSQNARGSLQDADGDPPTVLSETWDGWALVVGSWLPDGGATQIRQLTFRSPLLRAWTDRLRPRYHPFAEARRVGGHIDIEPVISTPIPGATLTFGFTPLRHDAGVAANIRIVPELRFVFDAPITIDAVWRAAILPTLHFLTFCVGVGDSVEGILMNREQEEDHAAASHARDSYGWPLWGGWFEWCPTSWMARPAIHSIPHQSEFVIAAPRGRDDFSRLLASWFTNYKRLTPALFDYLSTKLAPHMTIEESFYRVVRSLEVLDGILDSNPHIPRADFRRIKDKIKDALVGEEFGDFVYERLSHADERTLRERLERLISSAGYRLQDDLNANELKARIVRARNDMTHAGESDRLAGRDLYDAYHLLVLLMNSTLLRELGYSGPEIDAHLWETIDGRPVNPLYRISDEA